MPWVKQYLIGTGYTVQRETTQEVVDDIRPSMGDHNISEFPFPSVRVWDQEHEIDRAVRLLQHLAPEKLSIWADPVSHELPPHFPQPNADPIVILEAALAERDEQIASLYAEAKAWREQLEAALMRISELEAMTMGARSVGELHDKLSSLMAKTPWIEGIDVDAR